MEKSKDTSSPQRLTALESASQNKVFLATLDFKILQCLQRLDAFTQAGIETTQAQMDELQARQEARSTGKNAPGFRK